MTLEAWYFLAGMVAMASIDRFVLWPVAHRAALIKRRERARRVR